MKQPFNVTLPWNPADSSEGNYANSTWAETPDEALQNIAEEMADSKENAFDTPKDRQDYIDLLVNDELAEVTTCAGDLKWNLKELFAKELFPNGGRDINLEALRDVLAENRSRFVIER